MSSKSEVTPVRIGLLIDYLDDDGGFDENILPSLQLVADEYVEQGLLERPVEFVVRAVQGLPNGSFRAVRNAFFELVEQDSLVIFGPWVSENGAALRRYVEDLAEVACITMRFASSPSLSSPRVATVSGVPGTTSRLPRPRAAPLPARRRGHHVLAARVRADADLEHRPARTVQVQMVSDDQCVDLLPTRD
jgi:hypothetical protein